MKSKLGTKINLKMDESRERILRMWLISSYKPATIPQRSNRTNKETKIGELYRLIDLTIENLSSIHE